MRSLWRPRASAWGDNWSQRIDQELERCDYFVLLLSSKSATSEMVTEEVRRAKELRDTRESGKPQILPIRVNFPIASPLNYDLRGYLSRIQQREWQSDADTTPILQEILVVLGDRDGPSPQTIVAETTAAPLTEEPDAPPSPVAPPELPGGQVELASLYYMERPPIERNCYETVLKPGALIRIKAPRQMGKTSLMSRILRHAEASDYLTVPLSFQLADAAIFADLDKFLRWFCASVGRRLRLPNQLNDYWDDIFGSKDNCRASLAEYLLPEISQPLVLGLDEVDMVFEHPNIAADFMGLLRAWHELAKTDALWKKLRPVVVHSTEVYIPMNINQSPFNVGLPIELNEFRPEQVLDLAQRHGLSWDEADVARLMKMVGGHPYLVRVALYQVARQETTLNGLLAIAPTEAGPYGDHLRRHWWNLEQREEMAAAAKRVVASDSPVRLEPIQAFQLHSMGIVHLTQIGGDANVTADQWYAGFVLNLWHTFGLSSQIDFRQWWRDRADISSIQRLSEFIKTVLLEVLTQPIAIFIDEIDTTLSLNFAVDDFFALIRNCYNQRADNNAYDRLAFCLLGVAAPGDLIQDKARTPFNIGNAIALSGFRPEEAQPLLPGLSANADRPDAVLQAILSWTSGQPFLTQKLCRLTRSSSHIPAGQEESAITHLVQTRILDNWETQDEPEHLKTIRARLLSDEMTEGQRLGLYRQILSGETVSADSSRKQIELRLAGIVVERDSTLQPHNRIYETIFSTAWVNAALGRRRPYAADIQAWLESEPQSDAHLLQGDKLEAALEWAEARSLSKQDYQYLVESQKLGLRRELEAKQAAVEQTNRQLVEKNQALERINQQLATARQELTRVRRFFRWAIAFGIALVSALNFGAVWANGKRVEASKGREEAVEARNQAVEQEKAALTDLEATERENTQLADQNDTLDAGNQELAGENNNLKASNTALTAQNQQAAQAAVQSLAAQLTAQEETETAQAAAATARQQTTAAQAQLTQTRGALTTVQQGLTNAQTERDQAQSNAEAAQQEAIKAEQEAAEVERQQHNLADVFPIMAAVSTFAEGNQQEAIGQLSQILADNEDNAAVLIVRGEFHTQIDAADSLENALNDFDRAIALNEANFIAHAGRGNVLASLGRFFEAVEAYTIALRIEPNGNIVNNLKGVLNNLIVDQFISNSAQPVNLTSATGIGSGVSSKESNSYQVHWSDTNDFDFSEQETEIIAAASDLLLTIDSDDADALHYRGVSLNR